MNSDFQNGSETLWLCVIIFGIWMKTGFEDFELAMWYYDLVTSWWPAVISSTVYWQVFPWFLYQNKAEVNSWFFRILEKKYFTCLLSRPVYHLCVSLTSKVIKESPYTINQISRTRLFFVFFQDNVFSARSLYVLLSIFLQLTLYGFLGVYTVSLVGRLSLKIQSEDYLSLKIDPLAMN